MRQIFLFFAGALFSLSCFAFADGFIIAKRMGVPYNFLMWLPAIMVIVGMFLFRVTNATVLVDADNLLDDKGSRREKVLFFIGALLTVGGCAVALWKAIDPYSNLDDAWPGVFLVVQSLLLTLCSGILFFVRLQREDDWV
ncbi:putative Uncharacterized protein family (UPF0220) [Trypanosoma cruzi]|nr:putative Uncharacterized protein family (UPF0220) [Trypanosoma cruzi]